MRVFVTGATGFIGSAVVQELIQAGHHVIGLARSDASAKSLEAIGVEVVRGDLDDLESLKKGASVADGVIHTAFVNDLSNIVASCEKDRKSIEAIGSVLAGTDRPFVITSGTVLLRSGTMGTEDMPVDYAGFGALRGPSEAAALGLASRGVRVSVVRLPLSVHGPGDKLWAPFLIKTALEKGVSAYVGEGLNRWGAVHKQDAARLYRLALEKAPAGSVLHAAAEEGVTIKEIAEVIGKRANIPVVSKTPAEAAEHFGPSVVFAAIDNPASSNKTRDLLGWHPSGPTLIQDLNGEHYFMQGDKK